MKKQFVSLTPICLAFVALAAHAQSNVRIGGFVDLSMERIDTGRGSLTRQSSGQLNQSRLTFQGTEELGDGNAAVFDLQMPFSPDTGAGSSNGLFSRTATVGLTSATLGNLKVGRMQALSDETIASFWALRWGASTNYFLYYGNTTQLISNAIRYETPSLKGAVLSFQYAVDEHNGVGSVIEGQARYAYDKWKVNGAYYVSRNHEFVEPGSSVHIGTLGTSYDFGFAVPSILYQDTRTRNAVVNETNKYSLALSATVPLQQHSLWLDYGILRNRSLKDANAHAASVRYDYNLSKRTFVYAGIAQVWNQANAYYQPMGASGSYPVFTSPTGVSTGYATAYNGGNTRSLIVGIRTAF
ncbi:MAG: porin [Pseudomonadota bacterium]